MPTSSTQQVDVGTLLLDPHPPLVTITTFNKQTTLKLDTHPIPSVLNRTIYSETTTTRIITTVSYNPTNNNQTTNLHLGWNNPLADYLLQLLLTTSLVLLLINSSMLTLSLTCLVIGSMLIIMVCYLFEWICLPIHPSLQNDDARELYPSRINLSNQHLATVLLAPSSNNENKSVEI